MPILLAGTHVRSDDKLRSVESVTLQGKGEILGSNPEPKHAITSPMLPPGQYKRVAMPNYFGPCHKKFHYCEHVRLTRVKRVNPLPSSYKTRHSTSF